MIDTLVDDLKTRGRYDYVICDSVLNSVDSVEAEWSVLTVLKGLCKAGGSIFFSGRSRGELETVLKHKRRVPKAGFILLIITVLPRCTGRGTGFTRSFTLMMK